MLYIVVVLIAWLLISFFAWLALPYTYLEALYFTVCATAAVVAIDAFVATLSRLLPKKWLPEDGKAFVVNAKEKSFYEKLKIRKWKDKIPELGHFTGFRKNKLNDGKNPEYIKRFLLESRYGAVVHFCSCIFGFCILLPFSFLPAYWWAIALPVAIVNAFLNLPSLFILRYNSYKLTILYKSLQKKSR
jgi:glycosyl-4,4'-diaponeurosporenoate acyltransferase